MNSQPKWIVDLQKATDEYVHFIRTVALNHLEDSASSMALALDAENPDRICNFCYEPRSVCKLPGSWHSFVAGREYFYYKVVWKTVACPTCFAPPGLACEDDDGYRQPNGPQHPARVKAYEEQCEAPQ